MKSRSITGRDPATGNVLEVIIENGRIRAIIPSPIEEASWLSPGFIDLQVNGYLGSDVNADDVDPDVIFSLTKKMLALGVTSFLPTVITASEEKIIHALRAIAEARRANPVVAHAIPFVHVEGPFISPNNGPRGAHDREHVRPANLAEFERWQAACDGLVGMVTVSPHTDKSLAFISALANKGIVVAIGHSHASPAQIHVATDAGATLSTHLGNGLGSPLPRHPNLLWAQLAEDRLAATFIADGHHLPTDTLKAMLRAKTISRSILVSDVVSLGGMPAGIYQANVGGAVEVTPDGRVISASGGGFLAGAYRALPVGIAHAASIDGVSLGGAIQMATENPGHFVGRNGTLHIGAHADLVLFDWSPQQPVASALEIRTVFVAGEEVE
ncbi:MAG TPA: amidohydrolase family protein [Acidobacteriaceae bacterium]|nr:amidohydrolase family protein [Acidobacteriaceae bacterium]